MPARPTVDWDRIREELLSGMSVKALAVVYGVAEQTIRNKAATERWEIGKSRAELLRELAEGKAKEIEIAIDQIGSRLRGSSLRARVKMGEQVEKLLEALEEDSGMNALTKSRCLAALAQTAERVDRWSREMSGEELARLKTAAINMRLIKTTPEQLRLMARAKGAVRGPGAGGEEAAEG